MRSCKDSCIGSWIDLPGACDCILLIVAGSVAGKGAAVFPAVLK